MQPVQNLYLLEGRKLGQTNVAGLKLQTVKISLIETISLAFKNLVFFNYDTLRHISLRTFFCKVSWTVNSSICTPLLEEYAHEGMPSMNMSLQAR